MITYIVQQANAKKVYHAQIITQIEHFLAQEKFLLQRLGKQLYKPIAQQNTDLISMYLRSYEDLLFSLAKQGLTVPVNLQWVSFTVPQQIITSEGLLDNQVLAPDDNYYLQVVAEPEQLILSQPYTKTEMPEHMLLNMGIGILDADHHYLGHLDLRVALSAIHTYIADHIAYQSKLFDFKLNPANLVQPKIILNKSNYWLGLLRYATGILLPCIIFVMIVTYGYKIYKFFQEQSQALIQAQQKIELLNAYIDMQKSAADTQYKYGVMSLDLNRQNLQLIDVHSLLQDVKAVNAELALLRNVQLKFPSQSAIHQLRIRSNELRLMQILSGILYEMIVQLPSNSTIAVQIVISDIKPDTRMFVFKFTDDGFYTTLQDRQETVSSADIRAKGWNNIFALVDLEHGTLEHIHTAYTGNTISFSIISQLINNVINLETYLEEA